MIRNRSGNYDSLIDWFSNVNKNPLAEDTPKAQYLRQFVPFVSNIDRASYEWDQANAYLDANGLTWDEVDAIRMADKFSLKESANGILKLSKNVLKLYR